MQQKNQSETPEQVIRRRRNSVLERKEWIRLLFRILFLALLGWFLFSKVFFIAQAKGNDMFPAIKDGDLVIGFRLQKDYVKDDVVVCTVDGNTHIGRIAARGSDRVMMDESGELQVNGTTQGGEIMYPTYAKDGLKYPYEVPEGEVFLLGDYRTRAKDSRDFGTVPMKDVKGKAITILRRQGL